MRAGAFSTGRALRGDGEGGFDLFLYLFGGEAELVTLLGGERDSWLRRHTCVTRVPARKNTTRRTNGRFHGWTAWATAVRKAANIPAGVRDFFE